MKAIKVTGYNGNPYILNLDKITFINIEEGVIDFGGSTDEGWMRIDKASMKRVLEALDFIVMLNDNKTVGVI